MVNRRFSVIAIALVLGVSILGLRGFGLIGEPERSVAADTNAAEATTEIAKQELELAREALTLITQLEKQGQASPGSHEVCIWSRRLVEATRKSGATKAEVMQAIKDHLARMAERFSVVKRMHKEQVASQMDVLNAQYEAMEAKVWLEEEEGK